MRPLHTGGQEEPCHFPLDSSKQEEMETGVAESTYFVLMKWKDVFMSKDGIIAIHFLGEWQNLQGDAHSVF